MNTRKNYIAVPPHDQPDEVFDANLGIQLAETLNALKPWTKCDVEYTTIHPFSSGGAGVQMKLWHARYGASHAFAEVQYTGWTWNITRIQIIGHGHIERCPMAVRAVPYECRPPHPFLQACEKACLGTGRVWAKRYGQLMDAMAMPLAWRRAGDH